MIEFVNFLGLEIVSLSVVCARCASSDEMKRSIINTQCRAVVVGPTRVQAGVANGYGVAKGFAREGGAVASGFTR